jgi:DNA-binding HxlR family transcriptional regulator
VRLKTLADAGIIVRITAYDGSPATAYALTDRGECLLPVIEAMRTFGNRFLVDAR